MRSLEFWFAMTILGTLSHAVATAQPATPQPDPSYLEENIAAEIRQLPDFRATKTGAAEWTGAESIATLQLALTLAGDSQDVSEPVYVDLGFGFPIWLVPNQVETTQAAATSTDIRFGAVIRANSSDAVLKAGETATFLLLADASTAPSGLSWNSQLLRGLRTGDIHRVGFGGGVNSDWGITGYSIRINGQPFFERAGISASASKARADVQTKLVALGPQKASADRRLAELTALSQTGLAKPADTASLSDVRLKQSTIATSYSRVQAIVTGDFPWFVDDQFVPIAAVSGLVKKATVTIVNDSHSGAGTANHCYFSTGGRKYWLSDASEPKLAYAGARTFPLDLDAGPLSAAQMRTWAFGSLGTRQSTSATPDRWHPQRLVVRLDGRTVYDSDENPLDRKSLEAIRIVPPAQFDATGQVITNSLSVRETSLWQAGRAQGIDLISGGVQSLPEQSDPTYPQPEAGSIADEDSSASPPSSDLASSVDSASSGMTPRFPGETGMPGELAMPSTADGGSSSQSAAASEVPLTGDPSLGQDSALAPDAGTSPGDQTLPQQYVGPGQGLAPSPAVPSAPLPSAGPGFPSAGSTGGLVGPGSQSLLLPSLPSGSDPPPAGKPFQIKDVTITKGYRSDDKFTIRWTTSGDESSIAGYIVALRVLRPEQKKPYLKRVLQSKVSAGVYQYTASLDSFSTGSTGQVDKGSGLYDFLVPEVVALPKSSAKTPHVRFGAARAVFQSSKEMPLLAPLHLRTTFEAEPSTPTGSAKSVKKPIVWGPPLTKADSAVWVCGPTVAHNALMFADPKPAWTVAARSGSTDKSVNFQFRAANLSQGTYRLVAYFGFLGSGKQANSASVQMRSRLYGDDLSQVQWTGTRSAKLTSSAKGQPTPLQRLEQDVDTTNLLDNHVRLHVNFVVSGGKADLEHPAALFGIRLVPTRLSKWPVIPVETMPTQKADLWISGLPSIVRVNQPNQMLIHAQQGGKPLADAQISIQATGGEFISTGKSTVERGPHRTGQDGVWANQWTPKKSGTYTFKAQTIKGDYGGTAETKVRVVPKDLWPAYYQWPSNYPKEREPGWSHELQDLTHDDKNWYFSKGDTPEKHKIWKFPITHDLNASVSGPNPSAGILTAPIPPELAAGFHHFGGLDYYDGNLYVALEPIGYASPPKVVVFRASDLKMLAHADVTADPYPGHHLPYCAIDPRSGLMYSSVDDEVTKLTVHRPMLTQTSSGHELKLKHVGWFDLVDVAGNKVTVNSVQSCDITENGHLYLVSNDINKGGIYGFSLIEEKQLAFIPVYWKANFPDAEELEGITIWDLDRPAAPKFANPNWGGQVHLLILDNDWEAVDEDDFFIRHWRVPPGDLDKL
jgi:hypothetical protein